MQNYNLKHFSLPFYNLKTLCELIYIYKLKKSVKHDNLNKNANEWKDWIFGKQNCC